MCSFFLFYFSPKEFEPILHLQENWAWDKKEFAGLRNDARFNYKPIDFINGYKTETGVFFFKGGSFAIPENQFSEFPVIGKGHFLYKKIGSTVLYYSSNGEILWEKNYKSYPRISPDGSLILLTAGDGNQVLVANKNGDLTGVERVDGKFLTDISYSIEKNSALILFSGGEIYKLDENGKLIYQKNFSSEKEISFFKSSTISPNSNLIAIHSFRNNKDIIEIINEKNIILYSHILQSVYAHRIYMAINDKAETLINLPDKIIILNKNGKKEFEKNKTEKEGIYQIAFANNLFFAYNQNGVLKFTDNKGILFKEKKIPSESRIISTKKDSLFYLETPKEIYAIQKME